MEKVSIKDLKKNLSTIFEKAADGSPIEVTRYNEPFVYIYGASTPGLHIGSETGKLSAEPVIQRKLKTSALKLLQEDRDEDAER